MKAYAVLVMERHSDPDVELFALERDAVTCARAIVRQYAHPEYPDDVDETLTDSMSKGGWLYYGTWSPEGEYVIVIEREIQEV